MHDLPDEILSNILPKSLEIRLVSHRFRNIFDGRLDSELFLNIEEYVISKSHFPRAKFHIRSSHENISLLDKSDPRIVSIKIDGKLFFFQGAISSDRELRDISMPFIPRFNVKKCLFSKDVLEFIKDTGIDCCVFPSFTHIQLDSITLKSAEIYVFGPIINLPAMNVEKLTYKCPENLLDDLAREISMKVVFSHRNE